MMDDVPPPPYTEVDEPVQLPVPPETPGSPASPVGAAKRVALDATAHPRHTSEHSTPSSPSASLQSPRTQPSITSIWPPIHEPAVQERQRTPYSGTNFVVGEPGPSRQRDRPQAARSHVEDDRRMAEELQKTEDLKILEAERQKLEDAAYAQRLQQSSDEETQPTNVRASTSASGSTRHDPGLMDDIQLLDALVEGRVEEVLRSRLSAAVMTAFTPTTSELEYAQLLFSVADPDNLGIITGDAAVPLFQRSGISPDTLEEIWDILDHEKKGFITKDETAAAVRLMGHAQAGEDITEALIAKPGPLPTLEGIQRTDPQPQNTAPPLPPLDPVDRRKFLALFERTGPVNGRISAEKAQDLFLKSKLPFEVLSEIWILADVQNRESLDVNGFLVAMYLIQTAMSNPSFKIPLVLPPSFHASIMAPELPTPRSSNERRSGSTSSIPASPPASPTHQWDISREEKAKWDGYFDNLDTARCGYIKGDIAVGFMLGSKLPVAVLARIWDLTDFNNDGKLTRDGFAVAMHLIQEKLSGVDVPAKLPRSLIPPRLRN